MSAQPFRPGFWPGHATLDTTPLRRRRDPISGIQARSLYRKPYWSLSIVL